MEWIFDEGEPYRAMTGNIDHTVSRRGFIKLSAGCVVGLATWRFWADRAETAPLIILDNAQGVIIGDPTRCVACHRCELACSEFNDGRSSLRQARLKINRQVVSGAESIFVPAHGPQGGDQVFIELCRQCPHPVPCSLACPPQAIVQDPETGARLVDQNQCDGCRLCVRACPWGMISFDAESGKADKCFLCHGAPKCVEACPAAALTYRPWVDLTREPPRGQAFSPYVAPEQAASCLDCHDK
jgi:Fe-S-cluster-containing dehydrogenase component